MYGSWNNLWNGGTREPCYETYVLDELIPLVQRRLRIRTGRRWHAVAGLSGGGLGAMNFAAKKPGYFGQALSFSGVLDPESFELEYGVLDTATTAIVDAEKLMELGPGWARTTVSATRPRSASTGPDTTRWCSPGRYGTRGSTSATAAR